MDIGESIGQEKAARNRIENTALYLLGGVRKAAHLLDPHDRVEHVETGFAWPVGSGVKNTYPNFSHGTAGVAYFFAAAAPLFGGRNMSRSSVVGAPRGTATEIAIQGAEYLLSIGDITETTCRVPRFPPDEYAEGEPQLFYQSWCHGRREPPVCFTNSGKSPAMRNGAMSRDKLGEAVLSANLHEGDAQERLAGWGNNVGPCCGNVGVARFSLDMYEETQDERYLTLARRLTKDLLNRAIILPSPPRESGWG